MNPETVSFRLIKEIKDDRFDEDKIHQYVSLINIGSRDFQFAVIDSIDSRCLFLQDFVLSESLTTESYLQRLQALFETHTVLLAGFWKQVKVSFKSPAYTHVPKALFDEQHCIQYLQLNVRYESSREGVRWCENPESGSVTVFSCSSAILDWLKQIYGNSSVEVYHQTSALIETLLHETKAEKQPVLYLYVDRFRLHILAHRDSKLVFYNQFIIKQFSDYIRYIMLTLEGLGMEQVSSEVRLWGYLGKNSNHYHEFYKYIQSVRFGGRPSFLKFGYFFDEIQDHQFTDLFGIYRLH